MPIFWPEKQLEEWMEGSYIITQVRDRKRHIKEDYDEICRVSSDVVDFLLWTLMYNGNVGCSGVCGPGDTTRVHLGADDGREPQLWCQGEGANP